MNKVRRRLAGIRWATRFTLASGVIASGAANILHAEPNPISRIISAWPPLALLLTVELISRVPVNRWWMAAIRLAATTVIAGIAAWISYWHMTAVTASYGETGSAAYLLPFTVDGLVVVASISLVELNARIGNLDQPSQPVPATVEDRPEVAKPLPIREATPVVPIAIETSQDDQDDITDQVPTNGWPTAPLPTQLITTARQAAEEHLTETGQPISRDQLQKILRVSNATTGDVMRALGLNGQPKILATAAVSPLTGKPLL